ncbi:MAG: tetratricopeptide repeat protein [Proteobacteria bacterium]|nr:tetratricopeptide repeat protein [Pseudomonadota bacterium]
MKNTALKILLIALTLSTASCTKHINTELGFSENNEHIAEDEEIKSTLETNTKAEVYPLDDISDNQAFIKYYLLSRANTYRSSELSKIAESNNKLSELHPKNYEMQEKAFLLSLANRDFKNAAKHIENNSKEFFDLQEEFQISQLLKQDKLNEASKVLDSLIVKKNRLPHLKILKAYFNYNDHKNIASLESEILSIKSSLALDGFKYYYIAREYELLKNNTKALEFYSKAFFNSNLKSPEVLSRWIYTLKKAGKIKPNDALPTERIYGKNVFLVNKTFIEINKTKPVENSLSAIAAQVFFDLGWSITESSPSLIGLDFLALAEYAHQGYADKVKYQYAKGLVNNKWNKDSISILKTIKPKSEYHVASKLLLAELLGTSNKTKKATQILENLRTQKTLSSAYIDSILGQLYIHSENYKKAISTISNALKVHKTSKLYFTRAIAYERLGQYEKSIKDLNIALKKSPKNSLVLNYLGYLLVDLNQDVSRGLQLIEKSIEVDPTNAASIDSLGWAYVKLERYEEALVNLERAFKLNPTDGVIAGHLGDVYHHLNRSTEAKIYWKKALELETDDKRERNRVKAQLKKYGN